MSLLWRNGSLALVGGSLVWTTAAIDCACCPCVCCNDNTTATIELTFDPVGDFGGGTLLVEDIPQVMVGDERLCQWFLFLDPENGVWIDEDYGGGEFTVEIIYDCDTGAYTITCYFTGGTIDNTPFQWVVTDENPCSLTSLTLTSIAGPDPPGATVHGTVTFIPV